MADRTMVDYTQKIKPYFEGIAPIEPTTTATSTHAVGDKFYLNGTKVRCTTAIAVGDTITVGTNVEEADDVESEIQTLTNKVKGNWATGGVNLLTFDFEATKAVNVNGTWNDNVYTLNGATFTVYPDGTVVKSGTPSTTTQLYMNYISLPAGTYKLCGCPSGGSLSTYDVRYSNNYVDFGDGVEFTLAEAMNDIRVALTVRANNATVVFKPMVSSNLNVTYDDFAPYAKTNKELTAENQTLTNKLDDEVEVRAKLGAHNLVDIDGFTLIKSSARTKYIYPSDIIHGAIPSEQVVISFKVTNSNLSKSDNYFKAYGSNGEIGAVSFKANGRYSFVFDGASFNNFYIFISSNAESDETCTISEIMITLATDAYSEYVPYAMTNRELTEKINEEFLQNTASISAQINYKDVYLFTTNGGSSSGSAQYSSAYLVFGQATTQITYFALKEGTEITPSVDGTTFTLTASTSITMAYRKL